MKGRKRKTKKVTPQQLLEINVDRFVTYMESMPDLFQQIFYAWHVGHEESQVLLGAMKDPRFAKWISNNKDKILEMVKMLDEFHATVAAKFKMMDEKKEARLQTKP